ncbi:metallocarboxypeptidase A-like protein MCYG_01475 isoform X1 [Magnolia sinica]|uniref:metallocarboxypeptidase A-like protein MCYG_01475 isoform X1 n=1 Tax=Magnolia sinica TaxID=86752 RepID=UPI002658DDCE|nr:metallocarboxypeptidase A-like protein MCYG_01475 isoform X1 [Magnolia sinica]
MKRKKERAYSVQMGSFLSLSLLFFFFFSLLQLSTVVDGRNPSTHSFTPIIRDLYHSSDSLMKRVKALVGRHPDRLTMETIRAGSKGYSSEILVVTYNRVKKDIDSSSKFRILLSFGQHGRELITSEVALRLLGILSEEHKIPRIDMFSLNKILENLVIKVVPMENPNGRGLVEAGDLCERRNGRGVDLNRNWSVDWGKKEKDFDPYEENPGSAPFSEPETQIMRKISKSFNPHIWVNVHSGMEALFMPYDHRNTTPVGFAADIMRSMLENLNHLHCQDRCLVGSGGGSVGYLAHGTSTDYMHDIVKVPMAFTFEIYGDSETSSKDCFKMFNPIDRITFNRVVSSWTAAFITIFKTGPTWLDKIRSEASSNSGKWVSIDTYVEDNSKGRSKSSRRMEMLDLGMQELRTYFRLFLLSSVLLMFMFCSRISKNKCKVILPTPSH